jgi:hypothetical protein
MNPFKEDKLLWNDNREFKVFQAPERITQPLTNLTKKVFLAGTIDMGNSENWQEKVTEMLRERAGKGLFGKPYHIYNPRRDDWDESWVQTFENPQFFQQVSWELDAMEKADYIIMNFLPDSKSPITLLELGLMAESGKLHVVCPDEFYRSGNVQVICNKYNIPLYKTIEELIV